MNGIEYYRRAYGLSTETLAQQMHWSVHLTEKMERADETSSDSVSLLLKLSDYFQVPVDVLIAEMKYDPDTGARVA